MKTKLSLILASLAMAFSVGAGVAATNNDISNVDAADVDYSTCETYYSTKNKESLFSAVRTVAKQNRKSLTGDSAYKNLWEVYKTAYVKSNGKMFDYYSSTSNFTPGDDQAGSYSKEGDVYNREHCIPKSWWGSAETNQGADAYIVVPTDGFVNSKRSNYPFGYVSSATYQSDNGFSKLGPGKSSYGYTSTVFEPDDSLKGDFARIYYYAIVGWDDSYSWNVDKQNLGKVCFKGTYDATNHGLTDYAIKLLSEWSKLDPVSDWERSVNTKVKAAQGNVNPFIDHPEYADVIWKDATGYTKYANDTGITSISMTSATLTEGETTTISAVSSNSETISWSSNEETVATVSDSSAASGADVTITAVSEGTAKITASITISGTAYSADCTVTVTSSGGGGGSSGGTDVISASDLPASGSTYTDFEVTKTATYIGQTAKNGNNIQINNNSINRSIATSVSGGFIRSVSVTYGNANSKSIDVKVSNSAYSMGSTFNSGTKVGTLSSSNTTVNITGDYEYVSLWPSGATYPSSFEFVWESSETSDIAATINGNDAVSVNSQWTTGGITEDVSGDTVTGATYTFTASDGATITSSSQSNGTFTSSTTGTVTVSASKSGYAIASKTVTVNAAPIASITASVEKTYYVGETISSTDIIVEDNNGNPVTSFTFSSDGYKFAYSDAESGGILTNKTFTNAVSSGNLTCSLTVQVMRTAYVAPSTSATDTLNIGATGVESGSTDYINWSGVTSESSAVYAGNSAGGNESIQLRSKNSNSGIITTTSGGKLTEVSVVWNSDTESGRTLNVYGKNTAYSAATDLYNTSQQGTLLGTIVYGSSTSLTISGDYSYVGVRSNSGAMYLTSITFKYGSEETATNISNYIMYEDTNNQCNTKLDTAISYLNNLSQDELDSFASKTESEDYVIYTARTRLNAWAASKGKTINYSTAGHVVMNSYVNPITNAFEAGNATTIIIIIGIVGLTALGGYIFIRKRKEI